ncbi:hypothetical protein LTR95_017749 [Oleoguttula sp. CCFEE 5521]
MSKLQLQWQTEGSNAPFHNASISRCNDSLLYNEHLFNLDEPRQARRMGIGLLEKPFARIYVKNGKKPNDHALKEIAFQVMVKKRDAEVKAALIKAVDSSTTAVISSPVGSTQPHPDCTIAKTSAGVGATPADCTAVYDE